MAGVSSLHRSSLEGMNMMTPELLARLMKWIAVGDTRPFYRLWVWKKLRREILDNDKNECQWCKAKGYYTSADTVHHVQYLERYPELALSKTYIFQGKEYRNLVSLCRECHERHHNHKARQMNEPLTPERW